jgi:hypothetical protein
VIVIHVQPAEIKINNVTGNVLLEFNYFSISFFDMTKRKKSSS